MRGKAIDAAAIVSNVTQALDRRDDATKSFFLHGRQEFARIALPAQTAGGDGCNIEPTLSGETGFHRGVVKRANDEVSARMSLRSSRQNFIFARQPRLCFRPWDVAQERSGPSQEEGAAESENL